MLSNPLPPSVARLAPPLRSLAAALLIALFPVAAGAATIVVTSPDDTDPGAGGTCTLRQAIVSMNTGALAGSCANAGAAFGSGDTIHFAASALADAATPGTIALADSADASGAVGGTLVVTGAELTIDGSAWRGGGAGQYTDGVTIVRPDGANHRFGIVRDTAAAGGSLTLLGLSLGNGAATDACERNGGGGICIPTADLHLIDSTISDGDAAYGAGIYGGSGTLTVAGSTIRGGNAAYGGGIFSMSGTVMLDHSVLDGNVANCGGAVATAGTLIANDSTIGNGAALRRGGGIFTTTGSIRVNRSRLVGNDSYYGGGAILAKYAADITVAGSTISGNHARYVGGGIASYGGTLSVTNSTISGNSTFRGGGGIHANGTLSLRHATVSGNTTNGTGGGIDGDGGGAIDDSIVAGNAQASGDDIALAGSWTGDHNLTSATGLDLGPLQDNGGPTPTMLPGSASAAIDAIPAQECAEPTDQRGIARPQGAGCDIGAVEIVVDVIFADGFDGD
ncbi:choice-of-anchor Q domain-containing protein [Dokdonella sp.]|uniref:choice-of-anchor Q domain-containing protein n=1 Tax=Dokdonella sp. TaxID=2291710 RepID=UPI001B0399DE|nr:choice-of-anchor Q domain-containing protein [Dokdonella sp.]MBO9664785.1 CSLREA domain-containing protein [Dokdonella sp.]